MKKNVLYIGPYKQSDEWGANSKGFINLLKSIQDINLVVRPIWFNGESHFRLDEYADLEYKKLESYDVIIQHGLPSYLNYHGNCKNILITSLDCRVDNTDWPDHINLFDQTIVFSDNEKKLLNDSGLDNVVSLGLVPPYLSNKVEKLELNLNKQHKFYTIGSLDIKSGLREIIAGYLSAFTALDDVMLFVLANEPNILEEIDILKRGLGIFLRKEMYPPITAINNVSLPMYNYCHHNLDYYIEAGYNYRISQNMAAAIINGRIAIMPDTAKDLIPNYPLYIKTYQEAFLYQNRPIPNLYSCEFLSTLPNVSSIKQTMQNICREETVVEQAQESIYIFKKNIFNKLQSKIKEILCI